MKYLLALLFLASVTWGQTLPTCVGNQAKGKSVTLSDFDVANVGDSLLFFATSLGGKKATTSISDGVQSYSQVGGYVVALTGSAAEFIVSTSTVSSATVSTVWTSAPPTALIGCEMPGAAVVSQYLDSIGTSVHAMQSGAINISDDGLYLAVYCVGGGATNLTSWSSPTSGFSVIGTSEHSGCVAGWVQGPSIVSVEMDYAPDFILHASGQLTLFIMGEL
jgi:hypothetical protein